MIDAILDNLKGNEIPPSSDLARVERIKAIKAEEELLRKERKALEETLPDQVIYPNPDGTWTRWTRTDNLTELLEKGEIFRAAPIGRYSTKLENLKNKPKELGA